MVKYEENHGVSYKVHYFRQLLQPSYYQPEDTVEEVIDSVDRLLIIGSSLKQKIYVDIELTSEILSSFESTKPIELTLNQFFNPLFLLNIEF